MGTPAEVTQKVWDEFKDLSVRTKAGNPLYYYKPWNTAADNLKDFLVRKNGQCTAWVEYFVGELKAVGVQVPATPYVKLTPNAQFVGRQSAIGFLINNTVPLVRQIEAGEKGYPTIPFPAGYDRYNSYQQGETRGYGASAYIWGKG